MKPRCPRAPCEVGARRVIRDLQVFLISDAARRKKRLRPLKSVDAIFAPVCRFAVERLRQRTRRARPVIANTVWCDLERDLSERLALAMAATSRVYRRGVQALVPNSRQRSRSWIEIDPLDIFAEFPGALETAAHLISVWTEAQAELLARAARDRHEIGVKFFGKKTPLPVVRVHPGLSDPHDGGRTVTMVQFASGNRVIYKPRVCDGELVWFEALRWLHRDGLCPSFQIPTILRRTNYAWMEFLHPSACKNLCDVRLFYFRWGVQGALAQILGAADLHRGNWLAVGAQPILVDAESIGEIELNSCGEVAAGDRHLPAILRTGLLPIIARDRVGFYRGIAPFDDAVISNNATASQHWPRYRGAFHRPSEYVDEIASGFAAVAQPFAAKRMRDAFFKEVMLRIPTERRLLLRATKEYLRILCESLEPRHLIAPGARLRWLLEQCCASALDRGVGREEARSLLYCDIPKFTAHRRAIIGSRKAFAARISELKKGLRLLRSRIRVGADQSKANRSPPFVGAAHVLQ